MSGIAAMNSYADAITKVGEIGFVQDGRNPTVLMELTFATQAEAYAFYHQVVSQRGQNSIKLHLQADDGLLPVALERTNGGIPAEWREKRR